MRWKPLINRFLENVNKTESCWIWTGYKQSNGYGQIGVNYKNKLAHRVSYEIHIGKIPDGFLVRHSCDNPSCVNPSHLLLGTQKQNLEDMYFRERDNNSNYKKTHCVRGHKLENNVYIYPIKNLKVKNTAVRRVCKTCSLIRDKQRRKDG
jgi:hypothetical protein